MSNVLWGYEKQQKEFDVSIPKTNLKNEFMNEKKE